MSVSVQKLSSNRIKVVLVVLLVVVVGFFARSFVLGQDKVRVSLKWLNQSQFAGMFVASEKGYYRNSRLAVEYIEYDFEVSQIDNLMKGESDFALMSSEEFLTLADEGYPIKAVSAIYQISPYVIVSLKDSGIKTPADFKGKRLGNKGNKLESELFYKSLLQKVGLSKDGVSIVPVDFDKIEMDNLLDGDVDAIGLYQTDQLYFFDKAGIEYNIIHPKNYGVNIYNDVLVTTESMIEENPGVVERFVKVTARGWEYALSNTDEAVDYTMQFVTSTDYKDVEYEKYILENSSKLIKPNSQFRIGEMDLVEWEDLYMSLKETGAVGEIEVETVFTNEFLD